MSAQKEGRMGRRSAPILLSALLLLAACSTAGEPRTTHRAARAPLPTADTRAIDLASLEGRFVFGAGGDSLESTEVYTARADGSGLAQLTDNGIPDFDPSWSPDGSEIVFRRHHDGDDEIYVMSSDGSAPRNLTNDPAVDWGPEWSPDGRWIVFNSGRDSYRDLHGFVMTPEGRRLRRLADDLFIEYASWSPDGKKIAFSSQRDDCAFTDRAGCQDLNDIGEFHTLYVMDADGSNQTRVSDVFGQFPVWSPDGELIAFTPAPGGIYVMRPNGSDLTLIAIDGLAGDPQMPDWVA
jgi:Tol biopolymer transport system component